MNKIGFLRVVLLKTHLQLRISQKTIKTMRMILRKRRRRRRNLMLAVSISLEGKSITILLWME